MALESSPSCVDRWRAAGRAIRSQPGRRRDGTLSLSRRVAVMSLPLDTLGLMAPFDRNPTAPIASEITATAAIVQPRPAGVIR